MGGYFLKYLLTEHHKRTSVLFMKHLKWLSLTIGIILLDIYNIIGIPESLAPGIIKMLQVVGSILIVGFFVYNHFDWFNLAFRKLGDISYEFYLIHFVLLLSFRPFGMHPSLYIISTFVATLFLSWLLERHVSSPIRNSYKRKIQ